MSRMYLQCRFQEMFLTSKEFKSRLQLIEDGTSVVDDCTPFRAGVGWDGSFSALVDHVIPEYIFSNEISKVQKNCM